MKSPSSLKSTISWYFFCASLREKPIIAAFMNTFSRPVKPMWNPAPSSSRLVTRPRTE